MMKGFVIQQAQMEENLSNLTSASGDQASVSSNPQSSFASPNPAPNNPVKKKRNLPGNPDPEAEVIALSPKTLMATNRFVCEICNKGFQRDQNLQLHRRGHNLPWKLKQRSNKEVRKKVYVCPEATCVHHDPSRALGDLTGIKKHFSRKHGEKKWKCDKCSKKYAVQSDWRAHSKICGTREYRCDCGTLFSRRDSFITHRAFCDALAEESARAINHHPLLFPQPHDQQQPSPLQTDFPQPSSGLMINGSNVLQELSLKKEQQLSWLTACQQFSQENPQPSASLPPPYQLSTASPHMSATALLQKAAQMGATMSRPSHLGQMAAAHSTIASSGFGLGLSSHQEINGAGGGGGGGEFVHGSASVQQPQQQQHALLHDMMAAGFEGGAFEDAFRGMLGSKRVASSSGVESLARSHGRNEGGGSGGHGGGLGNGAGSGSDGLTRDFLGLRGAFSHGDILGMSGLETCMSSSSYDQPPQSKKPWHV